MTQITVRQLLKAYTQGIFPMAPSRDSEVLDWYCPAERGILPLEAPHVPRRLMRTVLSGAWHVTTDTDFEGTVRACGEAMPDREETWISPRLCALYIRLHHEGYAHSIEVRDDDGCFLGGLYGVALGGVFFGESMVSRVRDASKIALVHLVAALRQAGYHLLDTQYVTPHLQSLGGVSVSFAYYKSLLEEALTHKTVWPQDVSLAALRQSLLSIRADMRQNRTAQNKAGDNA